MSPSRSGSGILFLGMIRIRNIFSWIRNFGSSYRPGLSWNVLLISQFAGECVLSPNCIDVMLQLWSYKYECKCRESNVFNYSKVAEIQDKKRTKLHSYGYMFIFLKVGHCLRNSGMFMLVQVGLGIFVFLYNIQITIAEYPVFRISRQK